MKGYDNYITSGLTHRCVCGQYWCDADGHPCHAQCKYCGNIFPYYSLDNDGYCDECKRVECVSCGWEVCASEIEDDLCEDCREEIQKIEDMPFEELPLAMSEDLCPAACELLRERLSGDD